MAIDWKYLKCIMTNSTCYKKSYKMRGGPKSVLWHDTGCNNKNIRRYVQPLTSDKNCQEIINIIGKNPNGNDWNHSDRQAGVNAFIGVDKDGNVLTCQVLPWDMRPWGCGSGKYGSENDCAIQFEICQDAKNDKVYAQKVYDEAVKCTAWLCEKYKIDPKGTHKKNGVIVPNILCHYDSYKLGLGSNHDDIYDWFPSLIGKDMTDVRNDVYELITKRGWVKNSDGTWCYYLANGKLATGWKKIDKEWYYFNKNGIMQTGWLKDDGNRYYLKSNGKMATYWYQIKRDWYYFGKNGAMVSNKWITWKKEKYHFDKSGKMTTGWTKHSNGHWYWCFADGSLAKDGWIYDDHPEKPDKGYWHVGKTGRFDYQYPASWHKNKDGSRWWFKDDHGWMAKNRTVKIRGIDYHFDKDGYVTDREFVENKQKILSNPNEESFF